jgi:hypothetical protein
MYWGSCKSRLSAISRNCFLSRMRWRKRCLAFKRLWSKEKARRVRCEVSLEEMKRENGQLRFQLRATERQSKLAKPPSPDWESALETAVPNHTFPLGLIVLSVNLARVIGLRPTVSVLKIFFDWLGIPCKIPTYQTVRTWMQRIGLYRMLRAPQVDDGIWLVDHSMQIGKQKVLLVLRVRESRLPPKGTPLRHEDVEVLCFQAGEEWKREDVLQVYKTVAAKYGHPLSVVTDGAVELREPAERLKNKGKSPLVNRDLKHFLANRLEELLAKLPEWKEFMEELLKTRAKVQQTEMAHLSPPSLKQKARFMNLQPTLNWAMMVLWHLQHFASKARQGITVARMEDKFGWLRKFESWIHQWKECQDVISTALTFFNGNGVFRGSASAFRKMSGGVRYDSSRKLLEATIAFIRNIEKKLKVRQRLPISTEILESTFGLYKKIEQQHAKGGFTSLLPVFPTLLKPTTTEEVRKCFARVKTKDVTQWLKTNLPDTLAARRQRAYREANPKSKSKGATQMSAAA